MAERYPGDIMAANGFGCRHLHESEARPLYEADYPVPHNMRISASWRLSVGRVPVPPPPSGADQRTEIARSGASMWESSRNLPRYAPGSNTLTPAAATTPRGAAYGRAFPTACWRLSSSTSRAATRGSNTRRRPPSPVVATVLGHRGG
ncbi:hypothetical protein D1007_48811 [Hordeum vulgare]|nr:hypothetical protein D1007_48811 [Hordeum vulgare]